MKLRAARVVAAVVATGTVLGVGSSVSGAFGASTSTTPSSVAIQAGLSFTGAVITGPTMTAPRHLDAYQAAAFVQSWFVDAAFGHPQQQVPPNGVPVFRVDVTGTWSNPELVNTKTVYYAANATTVWISFPPQSGATASEPTTTPPAPTHWFVALARVRDAFAGTAKLVITGGTQTTLTPATAPGARGAGGSSGSNWPVILVVVAILAVVVGAVVRLRPRRSSTARR